MNTRIVSILLIIGLLFLVGCSAQVSTDVQVQEQVLEDTVESEPAAQDDMMDAQQMEESEEEPVEQESLEQNGSDDADEQQEVDEDQEIDQTKNLQNEAQEQEYFITVSDEGASPQSLTIKVGETVTWTNEREGKIKKLFIFGARFPCEDVQSEILEPGETFSHTFTQVGTCSIVDEMTTSKINTIVIE